MDDHRLIVRSNPAAKRCASRVSSKLRDLLVASRLRAEEVAGCAPCGTRGGSGLRRIRPKRRRRLSQTRGGSPVDTRPDPPTTTAACWPECGAGEPLTVRVAHGGAHQHLSPCVLQLFGAGPTWPPYCDLDHLMPAYGAIVFTNWDRSSHSRRAGDRRLILVR